MKTEKTLRLEEDIRQATKKIGVFGCHEVTIGYKGKERVDYMTYDTNGIFCCYEIKVTKADFHSKAKKSFVGHYNYYVLSDDLYMEVRSEIPNDIGIYIGKSCIRVAEKKTLTQEQTDVLKDSLIRSLYRDSDELIESKDAVMFEYYKKTAEQLMRSLDKSKTKYDQLLEKYNTLVEKLLDTLGKRKTIEILKNIK